MMLELEKQSVLVLGLGVSGRSAARFCADRGARVLAVDEREAGTIDGLDDLGPGVDLAIGRPFPDPADFDIVVPSPGVPRQRYAERAKRVWGDVELAYRALCGSGFALQGPVGTGVARPSQEAPGGRTIVAVTGTNGKSTTAVLIEAMLRAAGFRACAAGNLGPPALSLVGKALDVAVLEVSSFQLESTETFRPRVAVVLNTTPDHLDRHGSFETYVAAKTRITENQEPGDTLVLNFDDPVVKRMAESTRARVLPFRTSGPLDVGAWIDLGSWVLRTRSAEGTEEVVRIPFDGAALAGAHNLENIAASLTAIHALGADPERAAAALATFTGLRHRTEVVAVVGGVTFVDDSKATNPGAALRSLTSFEQPVVWIAGGRDKGLDFSVLAEAASQRVRAAVVIGEAAGALKDTLSGRLAVRAAESIEDAVRSAAGCAHVGDVVLLSPACASQDQFRDYIERGEHFRAAVEQLAAEERAR